MVSAITKTLRTNNKTVYVSLLSILTFLNVGLYSRFASIFYMGYSAIGSFSRISFCVDLWTGPSEI